MRVETRTFNIQEIQISLKCYIVLLAIVFSIGKVYAVCAYIADQHSLEWTSIRSWIVRKSATVCTYIAESAR